MAVDRHTAALLKAMEFTRQDLAANRQGRLTAFQHEKIALATNMMVDDLEDAPPLFGPGVVKLLVLAAAAGLAYWLGGFRLLARWLGAFYLPVVILVASLLVGPLLWRQFKYVMVRRRVPDLLIEGLEHLTLHSISGPGTVEIEEHPWGEADCWLAIDDKRFALTTAASEVFQDGTPYRVYYVYIGAIEFMVGVEQVTDA